MGRRRGGLDLDFEDRNAFSEQAREKNVVIFSDYCPPPNSPDDFLRPYESIQKCTASHPEVAPLLKSGSVFASWGGWKGAANDSLLKSCGFNLVGE